MSAPSFIRLGPSIGFNRFALEHWEFGARGEVQINFRSGSMLLLDGTDAQLFRNWVEINVKDAPMTHQPTLLDRR